MPGSNATSPSPSVGGDESSEALASVRRGDLSLDEYLETLVEAAVAHLKGRMPEDRLDVIRSIARGTLREAPEFREAVRSLTGQTPASPSESTPETPSE